MAGGPQQREGARLAQDHLHTQIDADASSIADASTNRSLGRRARTERQRRASRRAAFTSFGLVTAALGVLLAGGAMFSGASGAPGASDPLANAVRAVGVAPALGPVTGLALNDNVVGIAATVTGWSRPTAVSSASATPATTAPSEAPRPSLRSSR